MARIAAMSEREYLGDKERRKHGEYRTKRLARKRCDSIAIVIASRKPYVSPFSSASSDPLAAHPLDRQNTGERKPRGG